MGKRLVLTLMTFLLATVVSAEELTETIDRTFDVKPGAKVTVSNTNGGITVSSWDQPRVRVVARKEVRASRDQVREILKQLRVDLQPRDGGLVVTTHYPRRNDSAWTSFFDWLGGDDFNAQVRFDITVPRSMSVGVTNTNGSVRVAGINGSHDLSTTNGRIEVRRCAGAVDASTTNGSITAELLTVAKGQPMRFETTNGRIEVALPSTMSLDVDASTTNGSISSDLPVATTRTSKNSLRGTINGGGTPIRLRTTNGGISIRTAG